MIMRGLNDGRTISDAAFGMFRATVEETSLRGYHNYFMATIRNDLQSERGVEVGLGAYDASDPDPPATMMKPS